MSRFCVSFLVAGLQSSWYQQQMVSHLEQTLTMRAAKHLQARIVNFTAFLIVSLSQSTLEWGQNTEEYISVIH